MIKVNITGLDAAKRAFADLRLKMRRTIARKALVQGARLFREDARSRTPMLGAPVLYSKGQVIRKRGTARRAIVTSVARSSGTDSTVKARVTVKPAKVGKRGARSPNDPYYIRFLDRGTKKMRPYSMFEGAFRARIDAAVDVISGSIKRQLEQMFGANR